MGPLVGKPSRDGCGNAERGWGGAAAVVTRGSRQGAGAGPGAQDAGTARGSSALCSAMPTSGDQGAVG